MTMKKHFLLLLMAFMSISAWAVELNTLYSPDAYFGTVPVGIKVYTPGGVEVDPTNYTFDGYFSDAACSTSVTADAVKAADAGTTFYMQVTGKNGFTGSVTASFKIIPMPLTVTVGVATPHTKAYKGAEPSAADFAGYKESVKIDGGAAAPEAVANAVTVTGREEGEDVKYDAEGNVIGYAYTATITGQPNYEIGTINGTFKITPKDFTTANVTVTVSSDLIYNGQVQKSATVVVKDIALDKVLVENTDYTVSYPATADGAYKNAATWTVRVTGCGNYDKNDYINDTEHYKINAAPLLVTPTATKAYNGATTLPDVAAASFSYQGFVDNKKAADVTFDGANVTWALATGVTASANVGEYAIEITKTDGFELANYKFIPQPGTFTITPNTTLTVTAYPNQLEIEMDKLDQTKFTLGDGTYYAGDEDALKDAIKLVAGTVMAEDKTYSLTPDFKSATEIDNDGAIDKAVDAGAGTAEEKAAAKAARKAAAKQAILNYASLVPAGEGVVTPTAIAGKVSYKKTDLMIALKEDAYTLEKVYDGEEVPAITLDKTAAGLTVVGLKGTDAIGNGLNVDALQVEVVNNASNAGLYQLKLSGAVAESYNIIYVASQYEIKQRPLEVTVYDQTFKTGALVSSLNQDASMYSIETGEENEGLIAADKANEVFKLKFKIAAGAVTTAGDPATITNAADVAGGIIVGASDEDATKTKWANYDVTCVAGNVIIVAATAIELDDTKDLTTVIEEKAEAYDATVSFSARTLNAEQWNVLVLPGKVAVKALAAAFDYAVIDVLDKDASDGDIHFKLKVAGEIEANTPFLIYPSGVKNNLNQIVIDLTEVNKPAATVEVADKGGNKFVGTYKTTPIWGQDYRYFSKGMWYDARNYTEASPANIKPLRGYLDLSENANAAGARIFIEEPDGTTTAIKAITGEVISKSAEGWYTIGGVKLQGAPAQKGVYIKDGKKVVVK
jgi:hypothetical protein